MTEPSSTPAPPAPGGWGSELLIGLHVTKCAGTSLMTTVRRQLTEEQYYLCSSFHGNLMAGRPLSTDIVAWNKVKFIFGHYVNEDLLLSLGKRRTFLFTMLREPVERAVSHYLHQNVIRRQAGQPRLPAADYLAQNRNTICVELIRAFPSIARTVTGTLADKALHAIAMFDHVGASEGYAHAVAMLLGKLGLGDAAEVRDNVTAERLDEAEFAAEVAAVRAGAADAFAEDLRLYAHVEAHLGADDFGAALAATPLGQRLQLAPRAAHLKKLGTPQAGAARYAETERRHLVAELRTLGRTDWARDYLDRKIAAYAAIREQLP